MKFNQAILAYEYEQGRKVDNKTIFELSGSRSD